MILPFTLVIQPLTSGLWRVKGGDETRRDFPNHEQAARHAHHWAMSHKPCDIHTYNLYGTLKGIASYQFAPAEAGFRW